jgi:16S rRNA processing protein RimM
MRPGTGSSRTVVGAGRIAGVFGLSGELKLDASRLGADALRPGLAATLRYLDGTERAVEIAAVRHHKGRPLLRIRGVDDATAAEALGRPDVLIARSDAPLADGEFYDDDLVGCQVIDQDARACGAVVDVLHYPAQDMLVVGAARMLLPLVRAFVERIDVDAREIHVNAPPGLLDPAQADEA